MFPNAVHVKTTDLPCLLQPENYHHNLYRVRLLCYVSFHRQTFALLEPWSVTILDSTIFSSQGQVPVGFLKANCDLSLKKNIINLLDTQYKLMNCIYLRHLLSSRNFLFLWYVSVFLASKVACRFSDILCLPNASLENPELALSNDNL